MVTRSISVKDKVFDIADYLKTVPIIKNQSGVLSGSSGIILFQFYYSKYSENDLYADMALKNLENTIKNIGVEHNSLTFCSGLAGLGWVLDHLKSNDLLLVDCDSLLEQFDQILYDSMIADFEKNNLDFLHGALGISYYFLNRYNSTEGLKDKYYNILEKIIIRIKKAVVEHKTGFTWEFDIELSEFQKRSGFNFSLSHGMCSILNFLSRLPQSLILTHSLEKILKGGVDFILGFKGINEVGVSLFPSVIIPNSTIKNNSRLAWCYGDLGIGLTLLRISRLFPKDVLIFESALNILEHSALRFKKNNTNIEDAMICHGSFGVYQMFSYAFKHTGKNIFKDASEFWIKDGLSKAVHKDGYGGYKCWNAPQNKWISNTNLINGIAGIGLSLLSSISDDYGWDECLMIN